MRNAQRHQLWWKFRDCVMQQSGLLCHPWVDRYPTYCDEQQRESSGKHCSGFKVDFGPGPTPHRKRWHHVPGVDGVRRTLSGAQPSFHKRYTSKEGWTGSLALSTMMGTPLEDEYPTSFRDFSFFHIFSTPSLMSFILAQAPRP